MAFRLERDERVSDALARVVREELDGARADAKDPRAERAERIHAVRVRVKRARAALRLARDAPGPPTRGLDRRLGALGRSLAEARDAHVTEALLAALAREPPARRPLPAAPSTDGRRELARAARDLERLRRRVKRWPLEGDGRSVRRALVHTYRRARRMGASLEPRASAARYHGWRKVVKRLALQLRLLRRVAPELERFLNDPVERLADLLGEIHDLDLASARLAARGATAAEKKDLRALAARVRGHDRDARAQALALGVRALSPRPRDVRAWLRDGWRAWRHATDS